MRAKPFLLAGAAAAAALAVAAFAQAQNQPPGPMGPRMGHFRERMQERHERMLADLKAILRLRPDQEAAFKTFQGAMAPPNPPVMDRRGPPPADMTTPQMLQRREQMMDRARTVMQQRDQAIVAFYNTLSPDQQKAFDAMARLHHGGLMGGMGGGMGRHVFMLRDGPGGPGGPDGAGPPPPPGQ